LRGRRGLPRGDARKGAKPGKWGSGKGVSYNFKISGGEAEGIVFTGPHWRSRLARNQAQKFCARRLKRCWGDPGNPDDVWVPGEVKSGGKSGTSSSKEKEVQ